MLLKEDRFGKFWDCSGFPGCRHSEAVGDHGDQQMACPVCSGGQVVNKRTPTGKTFYVCLDADCEFMAWSRPHHIPCQVCDSPYLVEKKTLGGKSQLRCPRAGCNYTRNLDGAVGSDGPEAPAPPKKKVRRVRRVAKGSSGLKSGGKRRVRVVRRK